MDLNYFNYTYNKLDLKTRFEHLIKNIIIMASLFQFSTVLIFDNAGLHLGLIGVF